MLWPERSARVESIGPAVRSGPRARGSTRRQIGLAPARGAGNLLGPVETPSAAACDVWPNLPDQGRVAPGLRRLKIVGDLGPPAERRVPSGACESVVSLRGCLDPGTVASTSPPVAAHRQASRHGAQERDRFRVNLMIIQASKRTTSSRIPRRANTTAAMLAPRVVLAW
jgi:hypothetical protein